eukprot:TRINITY_DN9115_c0_g1_i1.p1 TRINITY_DN9115_c0_g1~~TRINITY_DN9115_c0_g1_i1.p1  ORF type:complete len:392 (+),score=86.54 TRINITY_DN9115_c0_g1_i1:85-1260(+)
MSVQDANSFFTKANSLFVDEQYEDALENYGMAIELDNNVSDYFVKRSFCHYKLKNYTDAVDDANKAIKLEPTNATAYLRKGMSAFALDEFESAKAAFVKGKSIDPGNTIFNTWIRKCNAEMEEDDEILVDTTSTPQVNKTTEPTQERKILDDMPALEPDDDNVPPKSKIPTPVVKTEAPVSTTPPTPQQQAPSAAKPKPPFRHEWYQNETHVMVSVFIKGCKKEQVTCTFTERQLDLCVKLQGNSEFQFNIDLCDKVVPSECKYEILSTKIEIKLKKHHPGKWKSLENVGQDGVTSWGVIQDSKPSRAKNWDKIATELTQDDKLEGEAALNKVFQDIFAGASEDQRRAMEKSFVESGGTVLSTNWDDVKKGTVKGSPPKGLEMKKWGEENQ